MLCDGHVPPPPTTVCSQIGGRQVPGDPGPRRQHQQFNSCSRCAPAPAPANSTLQPSTRSATNTTDKGAQPWPASGQDRGCLHRQWVGCCDHAGLSAPPLTSLRTEHTLKGNRALSNLTFKASTPTPREQTLPPDRAVTAVEQRGGPA